MIDVIIVPLHTIPDLKPEILGKLIIGTSYDKVDVVCRIYKYGRLQNTSGCEWFFYPNTKIFIIKQQVCCFEQFMESLKDNYPDDFEWMLWHPEVLTGVYNT